MKTPGKLVLRGPRQQLIASSAGKVKALTILFKKRSDLTRLPLIHPVTKYVSYTEGDALTVVRKSHRLRF